MVSDASNRVAGANAITSIPPSREFAVLSTRSGSYPLKVALAMIVCYEVELQDILRADGWISMPLSNGFWKRASTGLNDVLYLD